MREVRLYGELGRRFGRVHRFDVQTPAEAMSALCANYGAPFRQYLFEHREDPFRVLVGDEASDVPRMLQPFGRETLRIVPVIQGGAKSPYLGIIIGAVLIIVAGPVGGAIGGAIGLSAGATAGLVGAIGAVGWGLALGGVAQLLIQPPDAKTTKAVENLPSYSFGGPVNTTGQGNCVAVGYGRLVVGSQVVSAGVFTENI